MELITSQLLTWLLFSPLVGVGVMTFIPQARTNMVGVVGIGATAIPLVMVVWLLFLYTPGEGLMQFSHEIDWFQLAVSANQTLAFSYHVGIDGISLPLVMLTAFICFVTAIAALLYIERRRKLFFLLLLLLEVGMLGVFLSQNLLLFFLFFEITLVATYILIGQWGGVRREEAANHFLIYNGLGSGVLLLAFLVLLFLGGTLDYAGLQNEMRIIIATTDENELTYMLWGVFLAIWTAFAIKLPLFPLHSWMVRVHSEASAPVVMLHAGVLLKVGAYGLIRYGVVLFPTLMSQAGEVIALLGLISLFVGALIALVQTDLRRILAYASMSHMGLVLMGIAAQNEAGLSGAVLQSVSHGLISALLFFLIGALTVRTRSTSLARLGGLAHPYPLWSGFFLFAGLALLSLPTTSGFISELLIFLGLFAKHPLLAGIGTLALVLAAAYALRMVLQTTYGKGNAQSQLVGSDLHRSEMVPVFLLCASILFVGVYPQALTGPMSEAIQLVVTQMGG
ncbi:NuoM family protein [Mechercharimyces sp. CAU 1602]|uniref:complex I subunit 4 family protein n=1 Tax=Mechercharimyces sp. CAU 1602 TaxID=2973933 RepID=UPI0021627CCF|nr:NADH-quinone oxidoreductase subunit M [Mechercharimyces sp. CAU 1602]MCS1352268.1 NADH-quinone oxidoreductase subunit M [Mechercharimyces sp. CAU 1602]